MPNASHTPRPPALLDPAPRRVGLRSQRPRQFVAHRGDIAAKAVGVCAHRDDHLIHLIQRDIAPSSRSGRRGRFRPPPPRAPAPPRYRRASRPRPHPAATLRTAPSPPPAARSEEQTSKLQSLILNSYCVRRLTKKKKE